MEIGAEISHKIRTAIKTKLVELGAYVDNELPDYIMVMVANKKKKEQIIEDLLLFLGKNTESFADWLMEILQKLQIVTSDSETKSPKIKEGSSVSTTNSFQNANTTTKSNDMEESEDFLALKAEPEDDFIEELRDDNTDSNPNKLQKVETITPVAALSKIVPELIHSSIKPIVKTTAKIHPSTPKIQSGSRKRRMPESVIGAIRIVAPNEEHDYNSYNVASKSVASIIKVTERKSSVPAEMHANKSLLLKAVEAAHKSVKKSIPKVEPFQQKPIELFTSHFQESLGQQQIAYQANNKKEVFTVVHSARPQLFENLTSKAAVEETVMVPSSLTKRSEDPFPADSDYLDPQENLKDTRLIQYSDALLEDFTIKYVVKSPSHGSSKTGISQRIVKDINSKESSTATPNFIVTLDGADQFVKHSAKLKMPATDGRCNIKVTHSEDDLTSYDDKESSVKKLKFVERCRFWPACKNANGCSFHHPASPCRVFPNCKFGDKCLYIHPNCKFDTECIKNDCPFSHTYKRAADTTALNLPVAHMLAQQNICRFYPECKNMNCIFYHPKPCRFGMVCSRADCKFYHPSPPSRVKLKWLASSKI